MNTSFNDHLDGIEKQDNQPIDSLIYSKGLSLDSLMVYPNNKNIVDLESYSLLFRPLKDSTDIIQFTRYAYSQDNVNLIKSLINQQIGTEKAGPISAIASSVFIYLLRSEQLTMQAVTDQSNIRYWCVCDSVSSVVFSLVSDTDSLPNQSGDQRNDQQENSPLSDPLIIGKAFDFLMLVQPKAKRYQIDEIITIENQENSGFLNDKKAMDYLYNLGVFGTFR